MQATGVADTLSRAYLQDTSCNFLHSLESTDHILSLSMSTECLQVKHVSRDDPALQQLRRTILSGNNGA